jgi:DNA-binding transcriptional LysR family regulator
MIAWAEEAVLSQRRLLKSTETLRIASSAWLQEQVLIPKFAQLEKSIGPDIKVEFHVPTASLEERLLESLSDFAVACHPPESPEIAFRRLQKEKWIIVAPSRWKSSSLKNVERLIQLPFIRHLDSHQEIFLPWVKTPLEARLSMNSLNSVRAAVKKGLGWSVMPKLAALKDLEDGSLLELPIEVNVDDRFVCLWWLRNRSSVKSHASVLSRWICEA